MSALLGVVSSVVQAAATVSPTPSPTPSPALVDLTTASAPSLWDTVNNWASGVSQTDLIAFAAVVSVAVQGLLQKIPFFTHVEDYVQDVRRFTLAVFVPGVVTISAGLAQGRNDFHLLPVVFLGAQVVFYVVRFLVSKAIAAFTPAPTPPPTVTVTGTSTTGTTNF